MALFKNMSASFARRSTAFGITDGSDDDDDEDEVGDLTIEPQYANLSLNCYTGDCGGARHAVHVHAVRFLC